MPCDLCKMEDVELKEWKGVPLCPSCYDTMTSYDNEFSKAGMTYEQFFEKRMGDLVKKIISKAAAAAASKGKNN